MDQSASLRGAAGHALFLDCRSQDIRLVPFDADSAGLVTLVIDTKVSHSHAGGGYASRRASCERGAGILGVTALRDVGPDDLDAAAGRLDPETFRRVRHVVTENERVLQTVGILETAGPAAIGPLLDASHASMRDDFEISCPELDLAVEAARSAGAVGARMTGGGFGGSAIALTPAAAEQRGACRRRTCLRGGRVRPRRRSSASGRRPGRCAWHRRSVGWAHARSRHCFHCQKPDRTRVQRLAEG